MIDEELACRSYDLLLSYTKLYGEKLTKSEKSDLRSETKIYSFLSIKNIEIADMILYEWKEIHIDVVDLQNLSR